MKFAFDDHHMVTVSRDGIIILWRITDKEGVASRSVDRELTWSNEILVTKDELVEKNKINKELSNRIEELRMENEYQLRLKDLSYNEKIKELVEKSTQEIENLKTKNQVLKNERDKLVSATEEEIKDILDKHSQELESIESANNQKLLIEHSKYEELQTKSHRMQEQYELDIQELEESKEEAVSEVTRFYDQKLLEQKQLLAQAEDKAIQHQREYEEIRHQMEIDEDMELNSIKNKYERVIHEERDSNEQLKHEAGRLRKMELTLQRQIEDQKIENNRLVSEIGKLNKLVGNLEKDIAEFKREISERDVNLQEKEKRIFDLKKKNQELEKFKYVLDYKNRELKKQLEPKDEDIHNMKKQIESMEKELAKFNKKNTQLEISIAELKQKLKSNGKCLQDEQRRARDAESTIRRFQTDLHNVVGAIQDPKILKENISALYRKHVHEDMAKEAGIDSDIQKEYERHKRHLEKTVSSLKVKLNKDAKTQKADNIRIMKENVQLLKEINDLRRELKISRSHVHDLESALGLHSKQRKEGKTEFLVAIQTKNKNILMEQELLESKRVIEEQKKELTRVKSATTQRPTVSALLGQRSATIAAGNMNDSPSKREETLTEKLTEFKRVVEMQKGEIKRLRSAPPMRRYGKSRQAPVLNLTAKLSTQQQRAATFHE